MYVDKNNHSYIPLRFLNGFAGIQSNWNAADSKITLTQSGASITLTLGQAAAIINDKPVTLSEMAFSHSGTTYVPLSVISKAFGIQLEWNRNASSLTLTNGEDTAILPVLTGALIPTDSPAVVRATPTYKVGGRSFQVETVTVSLLHPRVKLDVVLAGNTIGKVEELSSLAKRNNAVVAINGTFFDAYTKEAYKAPYGYIVSGGQMLKNSSATDGRSLPMTRIIWQS